MTPPSQDAMTKLEEMARTLGTYFPGDWRTTLLETARLLAMEEEVSQGQTAEVAIHRLYDAYLAS